MNFRNFWETLNEGTNILGWSLIVTGAAIALKKPDIGGLLIAGGFTLLNNSKKRDLANSPSISDNKTTST